MNLELKIKPHILSSLCFFFSSEQNRNSNKRQGKEKGTERKISKKQETKEKGMETILGTKQKEKIDTKQPFKCHYGKKKK